MEGQLSDAKLTLRQGSETIGGLRQTLTASVAQTIVDHHYQDERCCTHLDCATCQRPLKVRPAVLRTVETLVGAIALDHEIGHLASISSWENLWFNPHQT